MPPALHLYSSPFLSLRANRISGLFCDWRRGFKDHDRGLNGAARVVGIEASVDLPPSGPQALALVALCCPAGDLAGTVDGTGRGVGVRLEVESPGGHGITQPFMAMVTRFGPSSK